MEFSIGGAVLETDRWFADDHGASLARSVEVHLGSPSAPAYAAVLELCGEHDLATSEEIEAALAPLTGDVLVDFSRCEFVDSTVIGVLLNKSRELKRDGHRLELALPPEQTQVARIVDVIGLRQLLTVHERLPERSLVTEDSATA